MIGIKLIDCIRWVLEASIQIRQDRVNSSQNIEPITFLWATHNWEHFFQFGFSLVFGKLLRSYLFEHWLLIFLYSCSQSLIFLGVSFFGGGFELTVCETALHKPRYNFANCFVCIDLDLLGILCNDAMYKPNSNHRLGSYKAPLFIIRGRIFMESHKLSDAFWVLRPNRTTPASLGEILSMCIFLAHLAN